MDVARSPGVIHFGSLGLGSLSSDKGPFLYMIGALEAVDESFYLYIMMVWGAEEIEVIKRTKRDNHGRFIKI
jgi:hypothetical protein